MDGSSLFLVRVWPRDRGFCASVRRASDERTHHFDRPEALLEHLAGHALRGTQPGPGPAHPAGPQTPAGVADWPC